jgi:type IV pilus assembly protein PilW
MARLTVIQPVHEAEMMSMVFVKRQAGSTLIELLISVAIGLIITASIVGFYINSTANSSQILKTSKLNQELTTLMTVIANDIRRAHFSGTLLEDPISNPFAVATETALFVNDIATTGGTNANECILFTYDQDITDGTAPVAADVHGFRRRTQDGIGYVEIREPGPATDVKHDDDCDSGNWARLTDPNTINITQLVFDKQTTCFNASEPDGVDDDGGGVSFDTDDDGVADSLDNPEEFDCDDFPPTSGDILLSIDTVGLQLAGQLVSDTSTSLELEQEVRIRNHIWNRAP